VTTVHYLSGKIPRENLEASPKFMEHHFFWVGGLFKSIVLILVCVYLCGLPSSVGVVPTEINQITCQNWKEVVGRCSVKCQRLGLQNFRAVSNPVRMLKVIN
jgi:hypothetical protein